MPKFEDARAFLPQTGRMAMLTRIVDYGEDWLLAEADLAQDNIFAEKSQLPAWACIEIMAQGIAALAGVQAHLAGHEVPMGFLLGTRKFQAEAAFLPLPCTVRVRVQESIRDATGFGVYHTALWLGETLFAQANLNVFSPDDAKKLRGEKL